ncbi:MAG: hypothetical protein LUE27_01480 [Clostridia bacterium]|nr:hypothetical protein [Clostridia bacterium]
MRNIIMRILSYPGITYKLPAIRRSISAGKISPLTMDTMEDVRAVSKIMVSSVYDQDLVNLEKFRSGFS